MLLGSFICWGGLASATRMWGGSGGERLQGRFAELGDFYYFCVIIGTAI